MNKHRLHLEKSIIGAVLIENCYSQVADILKPINFTGDHSRIWSVISSLYPDEPIDILTVNNRLIVCHRKSYAWELTNLLKGVKSSSHLQYWAICLLEIDIRSKLITLVSNEESRLKQDSNMELAGLCHQVVHDLEIHLNDVFETAKASEKFFHSYGLPELSEDIGNILDGVDARASQIKKYSQFNMLTRTLKRVIDDESIPLNPSNKRVTKALLDMAYQSALGGTVPSSINSIINQEVV